MLKFLEARFMILSQAHRAEKDDVKRFQLDAELKAVYTLLEMFRKATQRYYTLKILVHCILVKFGIKAMPKVPVEPKAEEVKQSPQLAVVPNIKNETEAKADVSNQEDVVKL